MRGPILFLGLGLLAACSTSDDSDCEGCNVRGYPGDGQGDGGFEGDGSGGGSDDGGTEDGGGDDGGSDGGSDGGDDGGSGSTGGDEGGGDEGGETGDSEEGCPSGAICEFPYEDSNDTSKSSTSSFDSYACKPSSDQSGPEVVYEIYLEEDGYIATSLDGLGSNVDVDVHILGSMDADDCYDRGHWDAGSYLAAGTYYVVVDSWVSGGTSYEGSYDLTIGYTPVDAFEPEGLDPAVMDMALHAFDVAWMDGDTDRFEYTVIDFSLPSYEEREFIMDLGTGELLYELYVTHGENSVQGNNWAWATKFSDTNDSHQSSLGMMKTGETYTGSYGYSLRLDGMETGYNGNVRSRAIVIHPWSYAREEVVDEYGYLGLSWGCPAIDDRISEEVIDTISDGTMVFTWYDDGDWSKNSGYLP